MSVVYDSEAKALVKLLDGFDGFNEELVDDITDEMRGNNGVMRKRFERKVGNQRTYEKLKPSTVKRKKARNERNVMVATGTLKGKTLASMKGEIKRRNIEFSATVPEYGKFHQEGIGNVQREYFSLNGKDGSPQPNDVLFFNRTVERRYDILLKKKGLRPRS